MLFLVCLIQISFHYTSKIIKYTIISQYDKSVMAHMAFYALRQKFHLQNLVRNNVVVFYSMFTLSAPFAIGCCFLISPNAFHAYSFFSNVPYSRFTIRHSPHHSLSLFNVPWHFPYKVPISYMSDPSIIAPECFMIMKVKEVIFTNLILWPYTTHTTIPHFPFTTHILVFTTHMRWFYKDYSQYIRHKDCWFLIPIKAIQNALCVCYDK